VKPLVLRLRAAPEQRLDMSSVTPQRLAGKSLREIEGVELQTTRRAVRVGDLFHASDGNAEHIVIAGAVLCDFKEVHIGTNRKRPFPNFLSPARLEQPVARIPNPGGSLRTMKAR
jgi:formylmethanofuran dehydrogenase subunit C